MKSIKEEYLEAEAERMKKRAFEEKEKILYQEFINKELLDNAKNRLDPHWRKTWDEFHDVWATRLIPNEHISPFYQLKLKKAGLK